MKILFGIQATGNGHISRSREVVHRLRSRGHEVQVLFSGRDPSGLKEIEVFKPFEVRRGLTFQTSRGRLQYLKTALTLNLPRFYRDIYDYDAAGVDLVITDYEPLSARVARRFRIPSIGFLQDLEDCNGVICGAGFELAGEALQLGKKLLVKPLKGQFEQLSNALVSLEKLQLARVMQRLDRKAVQIWLELPPNAPAGYPDTAQLIAVWIENGRWEDIGSLSKETWAQTGRVPRWDDLSLQPSKFFPAGRNAMCQTTPITESIGTSKEK